MGSKSRLLLNQSPYAVHPYLSVLLDDPSMTTPFYASLVSDEQDGNHNLIWSRAGRRDRD